ncbi:MAG: TFIIB-type zinc ribbon-containing protein [Ignisphaera sp.]
MYVATQLYRCPYCFSQPVWDFERGSIVCSSCGCVIDTIYDSSPNISNTSIELQPKIVKYIPKSITEIEKNRKDTEIAERKSRAIKTIKMLPDDIKKQCEYGIEIAYKVSPSLVEGKGLRSRYAVGYILYNIMIRQNIDVEEISKMFRISVSTSRRLIKQVQQRLDVEKRGEVIASTSINLYHS